MSFTGYEYYAFLYFVLAITLFVRLEYRWAFLLIFSLFFYSYGRWGYIVLLLISVSIDYFCAIAIKDAKNELHRKAFLVASVVANLTILAFFKYFLVFFEGWSWIEVRSSVMSPETKDILLPLGLSFYTLQSMGYTIDVFRGKTPPERHFGYFFLYVSFFPQLVAGPIERSYQLLPQLRNPQPVTAKDIERGIYLILFGLFKKLIVADRLFVLVREWSATPESIFGWQALCYGTFAFFAFYMDISAYTDIARGSARLFGIKLTRNFKRPFIALNIGDLWRRWHISLTSWLMDYLFRPLARLNKARWYRHFALIVTFLIIGLWHGPTVPFIVFGGLHGTLIVLERIAIANSIQLPESVFFVLLRWLRVQTVINLTGILFLAPTMSEAWTLFSRIWKSESFWGHEPLIEQLHGEVFAGFLFGGLFIVVLLGEVLNRDKVLNHIRRLHVAYRYALLYLVLFCILAFAERTSGDFIYFDF